MTTEAVASSLPAANIGSQLSAAAVRRPDAVAVAMPRGPRPQGRAAYECLTFAQLEADTNRLAAGLQEMGIQPGQRLVLMVPPSLDFIALTFALFKAGAVVVLIDPGMGRRNLLACLEAVEPHGFVGIPLAQAVRAAFKHRFPRARFNVTVGRRWGWGGTTLDRLRRGTHAAPSCLESTETDAAAIIFTTGSTGPPKGVLYRHGNFAAQVRQIRHRYAIRPGEIDLPGFPLFGLFNAAMEVTTVLPRMNPSRPANVDPRNIVRAIHDWQVTQAFGSPAIWNVVGRHCEATGVRLPTLRRVLSAGAPVPSHVLQRMRRAIAEDGEMHTPYGATEALPVASISASQVLGETSQLTARGAGTCVGTRFSDIQWKVIVPQEGPIPDLRQATELPAGSIGELIVRGPVVTSQYVTRSEANALAKIADGEGFWHRMGDVGYLDEQDRFWFCGRMAHRVRVSAQQTMYSVCCEAIANQHPHVYRSALVGVGPAGQQKPVLIVEPWKDRFPRRRAARAALLGEVEQLLRGSELTAGIESRHVLLRAALPVDIRHNAKIFREKLAIWAEEQLGR